MHDLRILATLEVNDRIVAAHTLPCAVIDGVTDNFIGFQGT